MSIIQCPHCGNIARASRNPRLDDAAWLKQKYVKERMTLKEVSKAAGASCLTVAAAVRKHGIEVTKQGARTR